MSDQLNNQVNPCKLFVGNLPFIIKEEKLQEIFGTFGEIVSINLIPDKTRPDAHKGFGFVEFKEEEAAQKAIEGLNETEGRRIIVNVAKPLVPRERSFGFRRNDSRSNFDRRPSYNDRRN